ncbi:MAG: exodeoxyribonuclease VII small subunit [Candidatus Omnitrophica bacterium]|nr:exodeoxyribonuclease VII small subunit [Candidatus Omnitrophota bacterium]MDD5488219.1 exodeoxyribonuclease VII small subunit [Candidatus Omnitrophota bacterium]
MKDLSFERAIKKLEKVVESLETGELGLEEALKQYEEGVKLARVCQEKLDNAKGKIEVLAGDKGMTPARKPYKQPEE